MRPCAVANETGKCLTRGPETVAGILPQWPTTVVGNRLTAYHQQQRRRPILSQNPSVDRLCIDAVAEIFRPALALGVGRLLQCGQQCFGLLPFCRILVSGNDTL